MLAADKDLLLAKLKQDLLGLHLLELNTVLNRFQNAMAGASLLGGFAFAGIVELELLDDKGEIEGQQLAESVFYVSASLALALSLYVVTVASFGTVVGYRLSIQSTEQQAISHATRMLLVHYRRVMVAGVGALLAIIVAAMSVVYVKTEKTVSSPSTTIFAVAE